MKAFGYLRVSGKGQVDGDGFPRQEAAIREYAAKNGIEIVHIYREKGESGKIETMDRPAFLEMMTALMSNGVTTVLIERLDRLSRHLMVQETCIADFRKKGLTILSTVEDDVMAEDDKDPTRVLVRQVLGAIAQYDRAMTVAKLRAARVRIKATTGRRMEGQKPYGSRPGEDAVIVRIKALRADDHAYERIAKMLNDESITPRKGKWHATTVKRILTSPPLRKKQV